MPRLLGSPGLRHRGGGLAGAQEDVFDPPVARGEFLLPADPAHGAGDREQPDADGIDDDRQAGGGERQQLDGSLL